MKKTTVIIGILSLLLIIAAGYIALEKYQEFRRGENMNAYVQGYNQGVVDTVLSLLRQTDNCNPAAVNFGNFTREIVDTACITKKE